MRLDELKWRPREPAHNFEIADVRRSDGKYIVLERYPNRTNYFALWLQPVPYNGRGVDWSVMSEDFRRAGDALTAQCILLELLREVTNATEAQDPAAT